MSECQFAGIGKPPICDLLHVLCVEPNANAEKCIHCQRARAEAAEAQVEKLRAQQRAAIAALERIPDAIGGEVYEHVEDALEALGVPTTEEAGR